MTDFIRAHGYNVSLSTDIIPNSIRNPVNSLRGRRPENMNDPLETGGGGGSSSSSVSIEGSPIIYLDGMRLSDFSAIARMNMNIVDEIYINKYALSFGIRGSFGGVIYIITKKGSIGGYSEWYSPETQTEVNINNAFNPPEKYQSPNYSNLESPIFQKYGALDWKAFLTTDSNGKSLFKLDSKGFKKVRLLIEGLNTDGQLLLWEQVIEIGK